MAMGLQQLSVSGLDTLGVYGAIDGLSLTQRREAEFWDATLPFESKQHESSFGVIFGPRRRGKTNLMVRMMQLLRIRERAAGIKAYSLANFPVDKSICDYWDPYLCEMLMDYGSPLHKAWGGLVVDCHIWIDEGQKAFPSRRSLANPNVQFMDFIADMGKLNCDVWFTLQNIMMFDKDFLWQTNRMVSPQKFFFGGHMHVLADWWDYWGMDTGWMDRRKRWPPNTLEKDGSTLFPFLDKVWGFYKTRYIVSPIRADYREELLRVQQVLGAPETGGIAGLTPLEDIPIMSAIPEVPLLDRLKAEETPFEVMPYLATLKQEFGIKHLSVTGAGKKLAELGFTLSEESGRLCAVYGVPS